MKKIVFIILVLICVKSVFGEVFVYKERDGKLIRTRVLELSKIDSKNYLAKEIEGENPSGIKMEYELNSNYALISWKYNLEKESTNITFTRVKNSIIPKGIYKGRVEEKTIKIDEAPWYENWGLGLKDFILSKNNITYFWSINPFDIKKIGKFRAEKIKTELIEINGKKQEALKVKIELNGILAMFFSSEYWFDKNDGKLLYAKNSENLILELIEYNK